MFNKKKNRKINNFFLLFIILFSGLSAIFLKQSNRNIDLSFNDKNLNIDNISFTNITIVSDDITSWNDKRSYLPAMVVDNSGKIHVVWHDYTKGPWTDDDWDEEIMYASSLDGITWSNATVISDGYNGVYWNDGNCDGPDIAVDNSGTIHVVWVDDTRGYWGGGPYDNEILYVSSPDGVTWSNATVISDGYNGVYWNDGDSCFPDIAVDNSGTIHVVWVDDTKGYWGNDTEIMYIFSSDGVTWSNATVISDGYNGVYWNNGTSYYPSITIDSNNNLYVVWNDCIFGPWGNDHEIFYMTYREKIGWSNATIISDGYNGVYWNDGDSYLSDIAVDNSGTIHVVWVDDTKGYWGNDTEIMYIFSSDGVTWSNATVISDGFNGVYWNSGKSNCPNIAVDYSGKIHVVWMDETIGPWSYNTKDQEIMYASSSNGVTWSNVTVISEGYNGVYWNNGGCGDPIIAIDSINKIHIVWYDFTIGSWGNDGEIMYIELVEDDSPVIIDPPHYEDGKIIWTAIDDDPNRYTLTRGESLVASGIWQSNVPVIVDIGYLDTGSYTFTVSLTDQAGYSVFDSVQFMIFFKMGDVNHDGVLNIVDSLLVAQYYVGLNPSPFYVKEADVDYNGNIDIIDALMIAQAYVGLNELPF